MVRQIQETGRIAPARRYLSENYKGTYMWSSNAFKNIFSLVMGINTDRYKSPRITQ